MKKAIVPFITLVLLALACGDSSDAQPTLFIIPTLEPSATTPPTTTPQPPTLTPPPPTATLDVAETVAVQEQVDYLAAYIIVVSAFEFAKEDFDSLFGLYIEGQISGDDEEWQNLVQDFIIAFYDTANEYDNLPVPDIFVQGHNILVGAMQDCVKGWQLLLDGVKLNSDELYQEGIPYIAACNAEWDEGKAAIKLAWAQAGPPP